MTGDETHEWIALLAAPSKSPSVINPVSSRPWETSLDIIRQAQRFGATWCRVDNCNRIAFTESELVKFIKHLREGRNE